MISTNRVLELLVELSNIKEINSIQKETIKKQQNVIREELGKNSLLRSEIEDLNNQIKELKEKMDVHYRYYIINPDKVLNIECTFTHT
jgi:hypothetical protein